MRMSSFKDPGPAANGKPLAMLAQRAATGESNGFYGAADAPTLPLVGAMFGDLHFFVRYSLREYTGFMWQHGGFLIRRRRIAWPASLYLRLKSTLGAALNFVLLGRGRRTYEFTIDKHGIVRTSGGVTLINWSDVTAVRTYSLGFMMVLKRGTLPIPFRCLNEAQRGTMRVLAAARREHALG
jgi:hypothetical protein